MPARKKHADVSTVVTYRRVSTEEQGDSGAGLEAQAAKVTDEITRRGWTLHADYVDIASGKSTVKRPGLAAALSDVQTGEAGTLMVAKLDRLSRSLLDFATITAEASRTGWNLVTLDLGLDLSTPTGKAMSGMVAVFAEWERAVIGQRTSDALRALQANGVILGRPTAVPAEVITRVVLARSAGETFEAIAERLNADEIPTGHDGTKWYRATVRALVRSQAGRAALAMAAITGEQHERA